MPSTARANRATTTSGFVSQPVTAATKRTQSKRGSSSRSAVEEVALADIDQNPSEPGQRARKRRRHDSHNSSHANGDAVLQAVNGRVAPKTKQTEPVSAPEPELVHVRHAHVSRRANRSRSRARKAIISLGSPKSRSGDVPAQDQEMTDDVQPGPSRAAGKQSASADAEAPKADASALEVTVLEAEIVVLRAQLAEKSSIVDRQHASLEAVHNTLQCEICLLTLDRPFAMAKCGHIACQGCLEAWFSQAPQQNRFLDEPELEQSLAARRKTCPLCRQVVTRRPIPIYLVKNLARLASAPNWLDKTATRDGTPLPDDANIDGDPFGKFFAQERPDGPIEDDNVLRCPNCMHEIYDGACEGCGRIWDHDEELLGGGGALWDLEDGSGDTDEDDNHSDLSDFIVQDEPGRRGITRLFDMLYGSPVGVRYDHSGSDSEDDDVQHHGFDTGSEEDGTEEEESEEDEDPPPRGRSRSHRTLPHNVQPMRDPSLNEEEEDEMEAAAAAAAAVPRRLGALNRVIDTDVSDEEEAPRPLWAAPRRSVGRSHAVPIVISSDAEDEDDSMGDAYEGDHEMRTSSRMGLASLRAAAKTKM
ncbi:hypothetical protein BKA62DRAFT_173704 [Auriculariales sp. MPI-PUGE-AT-0066]|nr:hypothetical protein BKA62DRAFT_173704 [Auriculariales sp. MPI-PUGE-AT-0066]